MHEDMTPETQPALLKPTYSYTRARYQGDDGEVIEKKGHLIDALWMASGDMLFHDYSILCVEGTDEQTGERVTIEGHDAVRAASIKLWPECFAVRGPRAIYNETLKKLADELAFVERRAQELDKALRLAGHEIEAIAVMKEARAVARHGAKLLAVAGQSTAQVPEIA